MKKLWLVVGAGAVTLFFFGFWLKDNPEVPCEDCIAAEKHFFQVFSSPTTDVELRTAKFQSLSSQSYPHFRVAISAEEAQYPDVQEWLTKEPVRFVKLPDTVPSNELMYQWVQTIPETDIVVVLPADLTLDENTLLQLHNVYTEPNTWATTTPSFITGYADLFQKINSSELDNNVAVQLRDLAQGHISSLNY